MFFKLRKTNKVHFNNKEKSLFLLLGLLLLCFSYSALLHKMLSGHRYFLPHFLMFAFIVFTLLSKIVSVRRMKRLSIVVCIVLLCGNFIKYPEKISTGWDSTLSHLPFYSLRTQMFDYIVDNNISFSDVSSGFAIKGNQNYIDLTSPKDLNIDGYQGDKKYHIYSNVFNATDEEIEEINNPQKYKQLTMMKKGNVFMGLYEKITE